MVPWPLARFGAAAQLLGRPPADWLPVTSGLGPELLARAHVVLGSDLESIGLATRLDPADPDAIQRAANALQKLAGDGAGSFVQSRATSPGPVGLTAMLHAAGATCSIEHRASGDLAAIAAAHDVSSAAREATRRLGPLAHLVDHAIDDWTSGARRVRVGAVTTDRAAVAGVLERSNIARGQQSYFADTVAVWTKWDPQMTIRVALDAKGLVDEVGVEFRQIPGEHLVRVWRTFRSRADLAQRIGAVVGAMGVESADRLELRMQRTDDPELQATFVPLDAPFSRPAN